MANDSQSHRGVVRGKTIELDQETGLPDGQEVVVIVQSATSGGPRTPGDGIRRSAGGWGEDPQGLDEFLLWNREQRKQGRREIPS